MRRSFFALMTAGLLAFPASAAAQQAFGVAGRVGTLGIGAEAALPLGSNFALRGGVGLMPFEVDATFDELDVTISLPETWYNIGADLYIGSSFRIGGGVLFKPDDPTAVGTANQSIEIGNEIYEPGDIGTITGTLDSSDEVPYVMIGFGRHTSSGIGLFLDLGVGFLGSPDVTLTSSGGLLSGQPELQAELDREAQDWEDEVGTYLELWPILNLGIKIGLGG